MKTNQLLPSFFALLLFSISACKKDDTQQESQGTAYNLLLKTVTTSNYSSQKIVVVYAYNAAGKVTSITTTGSGSGTADFINTEIIFRNALGLPENIEFTAPSGGSTTRVSTQNSFDVSGKTIKTIQVITGPQQTRDSAVYIYSGNLLQQRPEYRSINNGPYSLLVTANFQYTGTGNLDKAIFAWATHPGIDTLKFSYDDKVNSLPFARADAFYWSELFYDDYRQSNNIISFENPSINSYSSIFTYSANNKPLYRKKNYSGTANYDETYYYYD